MKKFWGNTSVYIMEAYLIEVREKVAWDRSRTHSIYLHSWTKL